MKKYVLFFFTFLSFSVSQALVSEVGYSYGRKKTSFDANNYIDSESQTASLSLYFSDVLAFEFNYTKALGLRAEKASSTEAKRTTLQTTEVIGGDLILILLGKQSPLQPYIKMGAAQLTRLQDVTIEGFTTNSIKPETALVPSYGAGLKIKLNEAFSIKISYDIWQTPIGQDANGNYLKTDDSYLKAGFTFYL